MSYFKEDVSLIGQIFVTAFGYSFFKLNS